jgi:DNA-binding transcriptional LysR family regulator
MRPEVRQLQYFVAVADELNFTRAAERLNVVQQALSTAIAQLEALLGIKLFERTTRSVALTTAGAAWLPYAREALAAAERAGDAAGALADGRAGRLRVGLAATSALDLTPRLLRTFAERYPLVEVSMEHFDFEDPSGGLHPRRSDVALVRPPFNEDGLDLVLIGAEPRFAVLAADHPLAGRAALDFAEIADEPWMDAPTDPLWCDFWRVVELRTEPPREGAICRSCNELFEAARAGTATGLVPQSIARAQDWPQLAFVEVRDIVPSTLAIAWRSDNRPLAVRNFVELATEFSTLSPSGPSIQPAATYIAPPTAVPRVPPAARTTSSSR